MFRASCSWPQQLPRWPGAPALPNTRGLSAPLLRGQWRPDLLRRTASNPLSTCAGLRRSYPQGREAGRPSLQAPTKYELVINLKKAKFWASTYHRLCSPAPTR